MKSVGKFHVESKSLARRSAKKRQNRSKSCRNHELYAGARSPFEVEIDFYACRKVLTSEPVHSWGRRQIEYVEHLPHLQKCGFSCTKAAATHLHTNVWMAHYYVIFWANDVVNKYLMGQSC